jgi:AraC-like DNA-binding protein
MPGRPVSLYKELAPPAVLAPYVDCLWVQEIGPGDRPYDQPVLPDGCMDIVVGETGVVVAGPDTRSTVVHKAPGSTSMGIRFRTGAAPPLLGTSAAEVRDLNVPLDAMWGRYGHSLAEQVGDAGDWRARLAVLLGGLVARRRHAPDLDPVATGVAALLSERPGASLPQLADHAGLSERQLRRRVEAAVGYPPRTLARILRFQHFLQTWRATPAHHGHRDLATLAVVTGYADQAHLTRESRRLAGLPPAAFLASEADRLAN